MVSPREDNKYLVLPFFFSFFPWFVVSFSKHLFPLFIPLFNYSFPFINNTNNVYINTNILKIIILIIIIWYNIRQNVIICKIKDIF